ncbi:hypothetical protein RHMOL_Rhmol09G0250600 [Rhododendron molle]|uniref:Uncharacterized protein n=1 Tax=Rhododendron molle TaxID=49168 RepID=A0ACC0MI84_RHOML|nr:hypothetical protein RHMOL_Rhmol09G0250600 [Rhododendron molle]
MIFDNSSSIVKLGGGGGVVVVVVVLVVVVDEVMVAVGSGGTSGGGVVVVVVMEWERSRNSDDPPVEIRVLGEEDRSKVMGLITSSFPFIAGTVCGIYIAQNYDVPNIKKVFNDAFSKAKHVEEKYRKPKRDVITQMIPNHVAIQIAPELKKLLIDDSLLDMLGSVPTHRLLSHGSLGSYSLSFLKPYPYPLLPFLSASLTARVHLPQREMAPLKSLEREYPIVDSTFQQFCASHSIFSVEDFLIQDLYVLALTFDTGFAFFLLD